MSSIKSVIIEVKIELKNLEDNFENIEKRLEYKESEFHWRGYAEDSRDAVALAIQSYYSCIENIFKIIMINIDDIKIEGESWHKRLLNIMSEPTDTRDAIVPKEYYNWLDDLRAFRHVVVKMYSYNLRDDKVKEVVKATLENHKGFSDHLTNWLNNLNKMNKNL